MPQTDTATPERIPERAGARLGVVDHARVAATLAVIWIHTPETDGLQTTTAVTRFAVPFFACAAGYFAATSPSATLRSDLLERTRQLYGKFLAWSAIYTAVRLVAAAVLGTLDRFHLPPLVDLVTSGPVHHLWFLPFAVLVSGLATLVRLRPLVPGRGVPVLLLAAIGLLILPRPSAVPASYFLALTRDHLPAGLLGMALGLVIPTRDRVSEVLRPFALPALAVALTATVLEVRWGRQLGLETLSGVAVFVAAAGARWRSPARAQALSKATLGVYLVHILFVEGLQDVLHGVLHLPSSAWLDLAIYGVTALSSFVLVLAALRSPRTRWLVA